MSLAHVMENFPGSGTSVGEQGGIRPDQQTVWGAEKRWET